MALILNLMMITWMCILNLLFYFTLTTQSFFSKSEDQLVSVFNTFTNYCSLWKLNINYDKTKILVFGDRTRRNRNIVDNHEIETVDSFKLLGAMFSKNRKFAMAKSHVAIKQETLCFVSIRK